MGSRAWDRRGRVFTWVRRPWITEIVYLTWVSRPGWLLWGGVCTSFSKQIWCSLLVLQEAWAFFCPVSVFVCVVFVLREARVFFQCTHLVLFVFFLREVCTFYQGIGLALLLVVRCVHVFRIRFRVRHCVFVATSVRLFLRFIVGVGIFCDKCARVLGHRVRIVSCCVRACFSTRGVHAFRVHRLRIVFVARDVHDLGGTYFVPVHMYMYIYILIFVRGRCELCMCFKAASGL